MRTNLAANDAAYNCVYECEDEEGKRGVRLSKDLMAIAGEALKVRVCVCVCAVCVCVLCVCVCVCVRARARV